MIKYFCDKCGKEIGKIEADANRWYSFEGKDFDHLCGDCAHEIRDLIWMGEQLVALKGSRNRSIIQANWDECFLCHERPPVHVHHIFGGSNRQHSEEDRLTVHLCFICHNDVHAGKYSGAMQLALHQLGQQMYEMNHTREDFMERYGRNWL